MALVTVIKMDILGECGKKIEKGKRDTWVRNNQKVKQQKGEGITLFF
jgi:hypothetical protein